jgi:hypothetical protein
VNAADREDRADRAVATFVDEILPTCQAAVGQAVALCYAQGSLISGYTTDADLDVIVVWEGDVPGHRTWLAPLHDVDEPAFFTYDATDLAIDRLWRQGQEFNLGHHGRHRFERHLSATADGRTLANDRVAQQVRSGFMRGRILVDTGPAEAWRRAAAPLPDGYVAEAVRRAHNDWAYARTELAKAAKRDDGLVFATVLANSVLHQVVAVFALAGQYYPGLKWLRRAMADAGVAEDAIGLHEAIWSTADRAAQLEAGDALAGWVTRTAAATAMAT